MRMGQDTGRPQNTDGLFLLKSKGMRASDMHTRRSRPYSSESRYASRRGSSSLNACVISNPADA